MIYIQVVNGAKMANHKMFKKWLVLSAIATALTLIPRRSSRNADTEVSNKDCNKANEQSRSHDNTTAS